MSTGALGAVRSVRLECRSSGLLPDHAGVRPALARQPLLATLPRMMVAEVLVHHLDLLAWMFGSCSLVRARLDHKVACIEGESTAALDLLAGSVPVALVGDMADPDSLPQLRDHLTIFGEQGSILFKDGLLHIEGTSRACEPFDLAADYDESYAAAIRHFVQCLRTGAEFETPAQWHLAVLQVCEAAYGSTPQGEVHG